MKKFIVIGSMLLVKSVFALPELAVTDLVYSDVVTNRVGVDNADVKGAIAKSGKFKVIHVPKGFDHDKLLFAENESSEDGVIPKLDDGSKYVLIGKINSANWNDSNYSIPNSNNYSVTRSVNMLVSYKLVRVKDKEVVAAFSVTPNSSYTAILKSGEKVYHNDSKMMKELSSDLATQVLNEITNHTSKTIDHGDKPMISHFKTYDN